MAIPGNFLSATTESIDPNTSGWVAKLNCAIALGSGGRNGDGALKLTSSAAGEMQARTVSSYPVAAGMTYQAFCDGSGATVPDRIGIRWLDASNAEISISWSLTTATASATWHRIKLGAVAPAAAVRAQVVVSALTPAGSGVIGYFENVYLGFPISTTGNLLGYNTESLDIDAAGWVAETNCSIARQAPMVQWPVDYYLAGGPVLALTVTANGNASAKTAAAASATPGVEYIGFTYLNPPTSAVSTWVELRFTDSGGSVLQTTRSTLAAPGTGWYRQIVSDIAPAGTAGVVVAAGIVSGTAAQVVRIDQIAVADAATAVASGLIATLPAGTVVTFADASFEQGVGTWTVTSGVATVARSTPWGSTAIHNAYSLKITSSTATTSVLKSGQYPVGAAGGQSWAATFDINVAVTGWTVLPDILWYDASNTLISSTNSGTASLPGAGWWVVTGDEDAPAGAVSAAIQLTLSCPSAGAIAYLDRVALRQALPEGSATVSADTASVQITLRDLTLTDTLTLWRVAADGTRTLVRGPDGLVDGLVITSETLVFEDYEAPLGVTFSYYDEMLHANGTFSRTDEWGQYVIPFDDINLAWLKDPGNPLRNVLVTVQTGPDWQRPIDQGAYLVKNRRNKITLSGVRNGNEGQLAIWTHSDEERAALDWLLDSGNILLWQTHPSAGVGNIYVSVGQSTEVRTGQIASDPFRVWTLPLVESDMPVTAGVASSAGRTWQDVLSQYATWSDALSAYATWEDLLFDRRIGA